jgi:hypothetical protein
LFQASAFNSNEVQAADRRLCSARFTVSADGWRRSPCWWPVVWWAPGTGRMALMEVAVSLA